MKRLLALFLSLVLMLGAVVPAYATGDGNFDGGGGGMGSGTSTNYWNPGMDGVRISVVNVDSHAVVGNSRERTGNIRFLGHLVTLVAGKLGMGRELGEVLAHGSMGGR